MKTISILCLFFLLVISCAKKEEVKINEKLLKRHIRTLSDNSFKGRAPGTEGEKKSIEYITSEYKRIGLKPINGSYTQKMNLILYQKVGKESSLSIKKGGRDFSLSMGEKEKKHVTYWSSKLKENISVENAEIIFVGYGVEAPEFGWDDFKGANVKGKILLMLNNDPQVIKEDGTLDEAYFKGETRTYYGRWTYKFEQAKKHGAAGAIIVHTTHSAGYGYNVLGNSGEEAHYTIDVVGGGERLAFMAHMDSLLSDKMARQIGKTLPDLFKMAKRKDFEPISLGLKLSSKIKTSISKVATHNIYGVLEGRGETLSDEYLVFSAHYDHKGVSKEKNARDSIYNGAWDNASGVASIMTIAEILSQKPLKRSVIFLACGAEESGTLGSQYFVASPPVPLNKIVGNINIDMPTVFGITRDMAVVGVTSNSLGDELKKIASKESVDGKNIVVNDDPNPNAGLFYRSDQVHFAKKGIPALFVMSGTDFVGKPKGFLDKMEKKMYHTVNDEWNQNWDLSGLVRDLNILLKMVRVVGDNREPPKWHHGNEFEDAYRELYQKK